MNVMHIHITVSIVRYKHVSGNFSQCKIVYLVHIYEPKPSQHILWKEFKCILSIIQFTRMLHLSISLYWLLDMHVSWTAFLCVSARLSYMYVFMYTWHTHMKRKPSQQILCNVMMVTCVMSLWSSFLIKTCP